MMTFRVTNTLTDEQEPLEVDGDEVMLYYCGLTTSDPAHLGHARGWVVVDVLHRWLDYRGYEVRHVENFTDVNEKIVARVGKHCDDESDVARRYVGKIIRDMRSLNLLRAEVYPRVSEHVPEIIDLVERLVEAGYAYESRGSVYFDVTTFEEYGALSNQDLDEIEHQGDPDELDEKRNPQDFALWKAGDVSSEAVAEHRGPDHPGDPPDPGGQTWESPWGEGRPGWHVECSAMSMTHLGETLDVHVGGRDLVFPHHENEIAQSEAATGRKFARYWLHVGMVQLPDEAKMSSSERNFTTVRRAVAEHGPNVLRGFLLSRAYGSPLTYSREALREAEQRWARLSRSHRRAVEAADSPDARTKVTDDRLGEALTEARGRFKAAMNDDLNTREAIAALLELAAAVNRHVDDHEEYDYRRLNRAVDTFESFGAEVLGLAFDGDTDGRVRLAEDVVELVLDVRERERAAGNYDRGDEIRDQLEALGVEVQDTDDGPEFHVE